MNKSEDTGSADAPWRNEDRLFEMRCEKRMTLQEIAEELGCSIQTISNWCEKYDIEIMEPWQDKEVLRRLYVERGLGSELVGEILGCNGDTVLTWLDKHNLPKKTAFKERPPTHYFRPDGYEAVKAYHKGVPYEMLIHRLVAIAEHGYEEVHGGVVHHENGVKWDNRPQNLEVCESTAEHKKKHRDVWAKKLTKDEVREIRQYHKSDKTAKEVSEMYPISKSMVYNIWAGDAWEWLD